MNHLGQIAELRGAGSWDYCTENQQIGFVDVTLLPKGEMDFYLTKNL